MSAVEDFELTATGAATEPGTGTGLVPPAARLGRAVRGDLQRPGHYRPHPPGRARRAVPPLGRGRALAPQRPHLRGRRDHRAVRLHQAHRPHPHRDRSLLMLALRRGGPGLGRLLVLLGLAYPLAATGGRAGVLRPPGKRFPDEERVPAGRPEPDRRALVPRAARCRQPPGHRRHTLGPPSTALVEAAAT